MSLEQLDQQQKSLDRETSFKKIIKLSLLSLENEIRFLYIFSSELTNSLSLKLTFCLMTKMVPADKNTMSSIGFLLQVYFIWSCFIVVYSYIYKYIQTRFAEIYWCNNNNNNNDTNNDNFKIWFLYLSLHN